MAFPSEASANPFGGPPSYLHQLRKGVEPITNPSPGPASGSRKRQHYGEVTLIPTKLYTTVMQTIKEHMENREQNKALFHIESARQNASNPNLYKYHMSEAARYHKVAQSKDTNDMIRNKVSDSQTIRIENEIQRLKKGPLNNPATLSRLRTLQIDLNHRKDILMQQETQAYNKYITNPFNTLPKTMPQNHSQRSLTEFLKNNRDMITPNREGHLIVDGKKISEDPHDVGRLIHYLTTDVSGPRPRGARELIRALEKRGFDIKNDLGNTFLKEKLRRLSQARHKTHQTPPTSSGVSSSAHSTPSSASTSSTPGSTTRPRSGSGPPKISSESLRLPRHEDDADDEDYETPKRTRKRGKRDPSSATPARTRSRKL